MCCHVIRMTLKLSEVKECVAAAKLGTEFQHPSQNSLKPESEVATHDSEDLSLTPLSSPSIDPAARSKKAADKADDSTSNEADAKEGGASDDLIIQPRSRPTLRSMATWQALAIWLVIILIFLIVVRRVLKLRRRAKSGLRSE